MGNKVIKLKCCPRVKYSTDRKLKKPTKRCSFRIENFYKKHKCRICSQHKHQCNAMPSILRYMKAEGIKVDYNIRFTCLLFQ